MKTDLAILICISLAIIALVIGLSLRAEPVELKEIKVRHIWSTDCDMGDYGYECRDRKEIVYD
jgi:hypothetical protein